MSEGPLHHSLDSSSYSNLLVCESTNLGNNSDGFWCMSSASSSTTIVTIKSIAFFFRSSDTTFSITISAHFPQIMANNTMKPLRIRCNISLDQKLLHKTDLKNRHYSISLVCVNRFPGDCFSCADPGKTFSLLFGCCQIKTLPKILISRTTFQIRITYLTVTSMI